MEIQINDNQWIGFPIPQNILNDIENNKAFVSDFDRDLKIFDMTISSIKHELVFWNKLHNRLSKVVKDTSIAELICEIYDEPLFDINRIETIEVINLKTLGINHKSKFKCYGEYYLKEELWHLEDNEEDTIDTETLGEDIIYDNNSTVIIIDEIAYLIKF